MLSGGYIRERISKKKEGGGQEKTIKKKDDKRRMGNCRSLSKSRGRLQKKPFYDEEKLGRETAEESGGKTAIKGQKTGEAGKKARKPQEND